MTFLDDLGAGRAWLSPAPIGIVEPGWTAVVGDMLDAIGCALAGSETGTVDVLDLSERDGLLRCSLVLDGERDAAVAAAVDAAVERARRRAALRRCFMAFGMPEAKLSSEALRRNAEKAGSLTVWHLACQKLTFQF